LECNNAEEQQNRKLNGFLLLTFNNFISFTFSSPVVTTYTAYYKSMLTGSVLLVLSGLRTIVVYFLTEQRFALATQDV
jgi:hypothetical protein